MLGSGCDVFSLLSALGEAPLVSFVRGTSGGTMDDHEGSVASSTDFYESDRKPDTPLRDGADARTELSPAKRKADHHPLIQEKRRKIDSPALPTPTNVNPCAGLPPAIWQHIFLCYSLSDLGRLLRVNRSFHSYLTDVQDVSFSDPDHGSLRLLKSESVWASARNALPVKSPKPLPGFSARDFGSLGNSPQPWHDSTIFLRLAPYVLC